MLFAINSYKSGGMSIGVIANKLRSLSDCLMNVPTDWEDLFQSYCLDLEIIYAVALDEGLTQLNEEKLNAVAEILAKIENLAQPMIIEHNVEASSDR